MVPSGRERAQINDMVKYNLGQYQLKVIPEVLRYGTIHKGRLQNFQDFQPPSPLCPHFTQPISTVRPQNLAIFNPTPPSLRTYFMEAP